MPHKILIVDDEPSNVMLVKFGLAAQKYDVLVAHNGAEAIEVVKQDNPDLIVLDVHMPKMNGLEFMGELKSIQGAKTTPVIMLTANQTMEEIFKLEGVKGYFVKPLEMDPLIDKIVECLGPNSKQL